MLSVKPSTAQNRVRAQAWFVRRAIESLYRVVQEMILSKVACSGWLHRHTEISLSLGADTGESFIWPDVRIRVIDASWTWQRAMYHDLIGITYLDSVAVGKVGVRFLADPAHECSWCALFLVGPWS